MCWAAIAVGTVRGPLGHHSRGACGVLDDTVTCCVMVSAGEGRSGAWSDKSHVLSQHGTTMVVARCSVACAWSCGTVVRCVYVCCMLRYVVYIVATVRYRNTRFVAQTDLLQNNAEVNRK